MTYEEYLNTKKQIEEGERIENSVRELNRYKQIFEVIKVNKSYFAGEDPLSTALVPADIIDNRFCDIVINRIEKKITEFQKKFENL